LTENAETLGPGELGTGLPLPHHDAELARLVAALNRMLVRLEASHATELAFAADAGHRLRTPVAALRAEAELALRETDPAELGAALNRIVGDADRLTSIVDGMLARTRDRTQPAEPVRRVVAVADERWRRQAALRGIDLVVEVAPGVTHELRCRELSDVVEPVVENALRHTADGGTIHVEVCPEADGRLVVEVRNSGQPIPAELAPHVFDAWVSGRDASVAGGLGLWLARETARDAGGDVVLLDSGDGTTCFRISLNAG
jgi:two-component system sensor histidine kinase TctE